MRHCTQQLAAYGQINSIPACQQHELNSMVHPACFELQQQRGPHEAQQKCHNSIRPADGGACSNNPVWRHNPQQQPSSSKTQMMQQLDCLPCGSRMQQPVLQQHKQQMFCRPVELPELTTQTMPHLQERQQSCKQLNTQLVPQQQQQRRRRRLQECCKQLQPQQRITGLVPQQQQCQESCNPFEPQQLSHSMQPVPQQKQQQKQHQESCKQLESQQQQLQTHLRKLTPTHACTACWFIWLLVLLSTAQGVPAAAALQDVLLPLNPGVYNPSLVVYQGAAWLVARSTQLAWDTTGLKWIINRAYLCQVNVTNWSNPSCYDFDPWRGSYGNQCRWGSAEWRVPWEAWGVDDTKLFHWPGRGLWAITGRRPQQPADSVYCPQPVVWKQWLVQLAREGEPPSPKQFDFPPSGPANITWGAKAGGGRRLKLLGLLGTGLSNMQTAAQAHSSSAGGDGGSNSINAVSTTSSSSNDGGGSSSSNTSARVQGGSRRRRRHRAPWLNANSSSSSSSSSNFEQPYRRVSTGVRRHWKVHTRPRYTPPGLQQQQQQQWKGLVDKLPGPDAATDSKLVMITAGHAQLGPPAPPKAVGKAAPVAAASAAAAPTGAAAASEAPHVPAAANQPAKSTAPGHTADAKQRVHLPQQAGETTTTNNPSGSSSSSSREGSDGSSSSSDGWDALWGKPPIPLAISDAKAVYGRQHSINEKNWMPFVWQGQLFVTYTVTPKHRVYQLRPDGLAEAKYESDPSAVFSPLGAAAAKLHGGPPLVFVNFTALKDDLEDPALAAATSLQGPYYLGVAHFWLPVPGSKDGRSYHHYLIKVEAQPPFRITQLSAELPVRYNAHYKRVAFVSGLDVAMLPQQQQPAQQQQQQTAQQLSSLTATSAAAAAGKKLQAWLQHAQLTAATNNRNAAAGAAGAAGNVGGMHGRKLQQQQHPQPFTTASLASTDGGQKSVMPLLAEAAERARHTAAAAAAAAGPAIRGDGVTASTPQQQQQQQPGVHRSAMQQVAEAAESARQAAAQKHLLHSDTAANITQQRQQQRQQQQPQPSVHTSALQRLAQAAADSRHAALAQHANPTTDREHHTVQATADAVHGLQQQQQQQQQRQKQQQQQQLVMHKTLLQQLADAAVDAQHAAAAAAPGTAQATKQTAAGLVAWRNRQQQQQQRVVTAGVPANENSASGEAVIASSSGDAAAAGLSHVLSVAAPAAANHNRQQHTTPAAPQQQQQQQKLLPHVLVSYGSGDWESHVTVMTLDDVERLFMAGASALDGSSSSSGGSSSSSSGGSSSSSAVSGAGRNMAVHTSAGAAVAASPNKAASADAAGSQVVGVAGPASDTLLTRPLQGTLKGTPSGDPAIEDHGEVDYESDATDAL